MAVAYKDEDFVAGMRGAKNVDRYSEGYLVGERLRKAYTFPTVQFPKPDTPPQINVALPHATSSGSGIRGLAIFTAIVGAILFAAVAGSSSGAPMAMVAAVIGAAAGGAVPYLLLLVGKLIVFSLKLVIYLLGIALVVALVGGVIYAIAIATSR